MSLLYTVFCYPLEYLMRLCFETAYWATGSYGASVIILSILVNTGLLPLYHLAERWKVQEKANRRRMDWELYSIRNRSVS